MTGQREETVPQPVGSGGGGQLVGQAESHQPVGEDRECQPDGIGRESSRGQVGQTGSFLEITDHGLHVGMGTVVSFQLRGCALAVSDQGVVAELGEEGSWLPGVGRTRRKMSRTFIPFWPKAT